MGLHPNTPVATNIKPSQSPDHSCADLNPAIRGVSAHPSALTFWDSSQRSAPLASGGNTVTASKLAS